jgi:cobalt-zinc-cadmium efflux system outer membrane protein
MNGNPCRRRMRALTGVVAGLWLAGTAWAEPAPPFAQLLRETAASPRIAALDADVEQAQGAAEQARARPNPNISLYGENFGGTSPYGGFGRTETTLQLAQPIEMGGKRALRIAAGRAGVAVAEARGREGRLTHAFELARAYAAVEVAERRIAFAQDEVEEATSDLKVARALVAGGKEARLRQLSAEAELNTLQADLEIARANHVAALAHLSARAGRATPYTGVTESLLNRFAALPASGPIDPLQAAAVRVADAERDAAARHLAVQQRVAVPDLNVQIGYRRLEIDNASALVAGVSLPLNLFDRNRGNIAAAQAQARAAEARAAAARLDVEAEIRAAQASFDASAARSGATARALTIAEESYRLARIGYEAGKSPLIELLAARHALGEARTAALDASAARLDAYAGLARLNGLTITGDPVQ